VAVRLKAFIVIVAACLVVSPAGATSAEQALQQGIRAFNSGDFETAVQSFEVAAAAGLEHPSLHQNLGSAYYRLGHYAKAAEHFQRLTHNSDYQKLAFYNLGLIANKQHNTTLANEWFTRVLSVPGNDTVSVLAERALETLANDPAKFTRISGLLSANVGYDSNVPTLQDNATNVRTSDNYTDLSALAYGRVLGNKINGVDLTLGIKSLNYSYSSNYEYLRPLAEILAYRRIDRFDISALAAYDNYFTKGNTLEKLTRVGAMAETDIGERATFGARYTWYHLTMVAAADAPFSGDMHQTRFDFNYFSSAGRSQIRFEHERNYRNAALYSPTRNTLRVAQEVDLSPRWKTTFNANVRSSDYPADATLSTQGSHRDERYMFGAELRWNYHRQFSISAVYDYTYNTSNLASYRYRRYTTGIVTAYTF